LTATIETTAPAVASVGAPSDGDYKAGQTLSFTVNTSEAVTVDTGGGTPRIALTVGGSTVYATYASGSGGTALVFTYTVQPGDTDSDGIAVGTLQANGGTLKDTAGNDMTLTLNSVGATTAVLVDTTAPTVDSVSVPANGSYGVGQHLDFTVNFDEAMTIDTSGGTPRIALTVGGSTVYADYASGSGSSALTFTYTVQAGDTDSDGIVVGALSANGGTLRDAAGNDATLTLNSVGSTASVLVDTTAPSAPSTPDLVAASDSGVSSTDNITNVTTPIFTGTAETGSTVTIYVDGNSVGTTTATGGNWSFTPGSALGEGAHTVTATATDTAGNVSPVSGGLSITIDATAPAAPVISGLAAGTDTGASASDGITNNTAPTVTGTAEANSTVTVYVDGSSVGTAAVDGSGAWSYVLGSALGEGSHTVQAAATNAAGDTGMHSGDFSFTIDTTAPQTTSLTLGDTPAQATALTYTATFSENVSGVSAADFALVTTGSASARIGGVTAVDGRTYVVTVDSLSGEGAVQLTLNTAGIHIADAAGNQLGSGLVSAAFQISKTTEIVPPTVLPPPPPASVADSGESRTVNQEKPAQPVTFASAPVVVTASSPATNVFATPTFGFGAAPNSGAIHTELAPAELPLTLTDTSHTLPVDTRGSFEIALPIPGGTDSTGLHLQATLADGRPLPSWLQFDPLTGVLRGTPPPGFHGDLNIKVTAVDSAGHRANNFVVLKGSAAVKRDQAAPGRSTGGEQGSNLPFGRPALHSQFAAQRHSGGASHDVLLEQLALAQRRAHTADQAGR
jgi:hypothetical protein